MLSNKMTVSLMSLITLLVFSLVAGDAFAAEKPFEIKIVGRTAVTYTALEDDLSTTDVDEDEVMVDLMIESAQPVGALTVTPVAFDKNGFVLAQGANPTDDGVDIETITVDDLPITPANADDPFYAMRTAKNRQLRVTITQIVDPDDATKGRIAKVVISIPAGQETTDPTVLATDGTDTKLDVSKLVQHTITLSKAVDTSNLPKVVSIQRLRPGSQTVVAAFQEERIAPEAFNVRIVLTEHPNGPDPLNAANLVEVENGTPSNLVVGTQFARFGGDGGAPGDQDATEAQQTVRPHPGEGHYYFDTMYAPLQATERMSTDMMDTVPMPTNSNDDMYRQYRVTVTPHQKSADFDIKIRVKEFHDGGSPASQHVCGSWLW